jgi:hypothetical protein
LEDSSYHSQNYISTQAFSGTSALYRPAAGLVSDNDVASRALLRGRILLDAIGVWQKRTNSEKY